MIRIIFLFLLITFYSCSKKNDASPELYVGFLKSNDSINIPFNFSLNDSLMFITNSKENINLSISNDNDSVKAQSPFFEDFLMFVSLKDSISGFYYNKSLQRKIPFFAKPGKNRFLFKNIYSDFDGKWKVVFNYNTRTSFSSEMIISQSKNDISGTVRTETGDYGFMEGVVSDNKMSMSNFNGYRGYMIEGYLKGDTIKGNLYRGNYDVKNFIAYKDESFKLPDPYGLTKMKNGIEKFNFSFKNEFGELISSSDNKFIGKINLIQIMGSWCPNCLDESRFLLELSKKYNNINVTAIAFEFANSEEKAINNIKKLKNSLGIDYDILLAQYNSSNKIDAAQKLSSLDTLISYPTLIVVDKKQKVRRIHTGFNGPATGESYDLFKKEFEDFLQKLILE